MLVNTGIRVTRLYPCSFPSATERSETSVTPDYRES